MPIELTIQNGNIHGGAAKLTAGSLAAIQTRAMTASDHICGNEDVFYPPLTELEHAMPAYAVADSYSGRRIRRNLEQPLQAQQFRGHVPSSGGIGQT